MSIWPANKRFIADACKHYPSGAPRDHYKECDAPIMAIGEAGGRNENQKGVPFVGAAGHLLDRLLGVAGLSRSDLLLTNVVPFQPPVGNKWESIPPEAVAKGTLRLQQKARYFRGKVIVPLGSHALQALTGHASIMKWRGSVLDYDTKWLVGTIHPAAILRQPLLTKTTLHDWRRIHDIVENGWTPARPEFIPTTGDDERLAGLAHSVVLATDIETVKGTPRVLCISFCGDGQVSYSVDCRKGIPRIVKTLLESDVPKALTNGLFDLYILHVNQIRVRNFCYDTSLLFHALDNNAGPVTAASSEHGKSIIRPYSLAYGASVFTTLPYWKDSGKDMGEGESERGARRDWGSFSRYNANDSLGSWQIARRLVKELKAVGRYEHYKEHYRKLLYPLLDLSLRGVRFDVAGAAAESRRLGDVLRGLRDRSESLAGHPLRTIKVFKKEPKVKEGRKDKLAIRQLDDNSWIGERKSISNIILQNYLYKKPPEGLGLKVQRKPGQAGRTSDEVALRNLLLYVKEGGDSKRRWKGDPAHVTEFLQTILAFREAEKTIQFLNPEAIDCDGRVRAAYGLTVQSGRLRSSGNPAGTGYNLQNIQRDVRHFYVPDTPEELGSDPNEPIYFLELDYKQAEDLIVKAISHAITGDPRPLDLIHDVQSGRRDIHKGLATTWTGKRPDDITYEERYVTKRCRHGINNGMRFRRMQQTLLKDGFVLPLHEVRRIFRAINEAEPWVEEFHREIRRTVMRYGGVATQWGWELDLRTEMADWVSARQKDEAYKRGYTFVEQSCVGVMMKQWGLMGYWTEIRPYYKARLNMLVHDNVVLSVPRSELYNVMKTMHNSLVREMDYGIYHPSFCTCGACDKVKTCRIAIPVEIKISRTLSCTCERCKSLPKPWELSGLPSERDFWVLLKEWEKAQAST